MSHCGKKCAETGAGTNDFYRFLDENVSQPLTLPVCRPVVNQRWRWALVPWVKLSGTTARPADCFAGVWARRSQQAQGWRLEPGDIEQALNAASQIGDDKLQKQSRGRVVPESFTHGTSAQRVSWFKRGVETGSVDACNTFEGREL